MKRMISIIMVSSLVIVGLLTPVAGAAGTNNFVISNYDMKLSLERDSDKRSVLTTTETITADFPSSNQNHGIERYIPKKYDGHTTDLKIKSVTDATGKSLKYSTYTSGDYTVLRIGDAKKYVHGNQTYKFSYTQHDVTKHYADTGKDEFYWDTNGTEWRVPINRLNVEIEIDQSLKDSLSTDVQCYKGLSGESGGCSLLKLGDKYVGHNYNLSSGQNVTVALGFESGTFADFTPSLRQQLMTAWLGLQALTMPIFIVGLILICVRYWQIASRRKDVGMVVPEYIPPKGASVYVSSTMLGSTKWFAAQLIDLAVRHYLKIYETKPKTIWRSAEYEIEVIKSTDDLLEEEKEFLSDIFGSTPGVGKKISTKDMRKDYKIGRRLSDNPAKISKMMRNQYGLEHKDPAKARKFKTYAIIIAIIGLVLLSPLLLGLAFVSWIMSKVIWIRTDKGVDLYRYLQGLKMYISVAETERIKMLQSPEGAKKSQVNSDDPKQLVHLYERVLPYAILFNQEKEWNKQLGSYYESARSQPDWYAGASYGAFNAAAFSSAISNMTTSISSAGASSSSSGGSSGGGFSGGGGGGGGGGGW